MKQSGNLRYVLAGYAGAGKTTLAKSLSKKIGGIMFLAYTGKAANVLREKGCENVRTIHSAIYRLEGEDEGEPHFTLNLDSDIKNAKLVIIDEYSMLPVELRQDIEKLARKVLYLGDPFQLPPVNGECDLQPDFFITEIHRQALDSPIIRYATDVREGRGLQFVSLPEFTYQPQAQIAPELYEQADQIIVGRNDTRRMWNARFRAKKGFDYNGEFPCMDDKLICIKNNKESGLFNGMIGVATDDAVTDGDHIVMVDFSDGKLSLKNVKAWAGVFRGEEQGAKFTYGLDRFDYAYAITCHKSQGSEFDSVLIYDQPVGRTDRDRARWRYTAITRGKNKVTLVKPTQKVTR